VVLEADEYKAQITISVSDTDTARKLAEGEQKQSGEKFSLDGTMATKWLESKEKKAQGYILAIKGDRVYSILFECLSQECFETNKQYYLNIFNQILSTFKFLDQTSSTENWKTYTNSKYKYSLRYPDESSGLKSFTCNQGQYGDTDLFVLEKVDAQMVPCTPKDSYYAIEIWSAQGKPIGDSELGGFEGAESTREKIIIDGMEAIKATFQRTKPAPIPEDWIEILLYKEGVRYRFILSNIAHKDTFGQILSSFKFLE
jgi:hypothetical protein